MIVNSKVGDTAVLPDGTLVTIQQVYRAPDKRVTLLTVPDGKWHTAWELRPAWTDKAVKQ